MYNDQYTKKANSRKKLLIGVVVAFFVIAIGVISYIAWYKSTYSAALSLIYTPASAIATANGQTVQSGTTAMKPGTYTIIIKKSGFSTSTNKVTLTKNNTSTVTAILASNSPETSGWYNSHPADQSIKERIGAINSTNASSNLQQNFKVANILPPNGPDYSISYGTSPDHQGQYALYISYTGGSQGQQDAVSVVSNQGYNAYNYEIVWTDNDNTPATQTITQAGYTPPSSN